MSRSLLLALERMDWDALQAALARQAPSGHDWGGAGAGSENRHGQSSAFGGANLLLPHMVMFFLGHSGRLDATVDYHFALMSRQI